MSDRFGTSLFVWASPFAAVLFAAAPFAAAQSNAFSEFANRSPSRADLDLVRAHVRFLADDHLEGRAPGTHGGDIAARYLASQLELLGVNPGGTDGTYFQRVPLLGIQTDYSKSHAEIVNTDPSAPGTLPLTFLDDFVIGNESQVEQVDVKAGIVFVGYGIQAPEQQWDDWKGVDVKGKVVLMLVNDPPSEDPKVFGGKGLTYYGRWTYKYEEATRRGASAAILIHRDDMAGYGWNVVRTSFARERPYVDARGDGQHRLPIVGWMSESKAKQLVELAGKKLEDLMTEATKKEFQPVALPLELKASLTSALRPLDTANVLGVIPGSKRPEQCVIYSAHYDHLGKDEALIRDGKDGIYNGAVDNATGCAALLWMAREFMAMPDRPERSIVFLFTTAEEGGLRGSQYYAEHPTFPLASIAANINLDALVVVGEPEQFEPLGYDRSTLRRPVELTAREFSVELLPDTNPGAGSFYRSDHFPFAKVGVPAVNVKAGQKMKGEDLEVSQKRSGEYGKLRYHQPSDEYDPSWDFFGLVKTARFAGRIGLRVANDPEMPRYNAGDEFAKPR